MPEYNLGVNILRIGSNKLLVNLPGSLPKGVTDIFLKIDYTGDTDMALMNGYLVDDHFWYGKPWELGLKRFIDSGSGNEMNFYFRPIYKNASFLGNIDEKIPAINDTTSYIMINNIIFEPEYKVRITFN